MHGLIGGTDRQHVPAVVDASDVDRRQSVCRVTLSRRPQKTSLYRCRWLLLLLLVRRGRQDDDARVTVARPATSFSVTRVDSKLSLWRRLFDNDALITDHTHTVTDGDMGEGRRAGFHWPTGTESETSCLPLEASKSCAIIPCNKTGRHRIKTFKQS